MLYRSTRKKYPGEYCEKNEDCLNNVCTIDHACFGYPKDKICEKDSDCDFDYYCNTTAGNNICQLLAQEGDPCNEAPTEGEALIKCDPNYFCGNRTCVKLGSILAGKKVMNPLACLAFHTVENICIGPYILRGYNDTKEPIVENTTCVYDYYDNGIERNFTHDPVCGNNSKHYCYPPNNNINIENVRICIYLS